MTTLRREKRLRQVQRDIEEAERAEKEAVAATTRAQEALTRAEQASDWGATPNSPSPRHAGGPREIFDGGLPYHSACVFLQLLFFAFLLAS